MFNYKNITIREDFIVYYIFLLISTICLAIFVIVKDSIMIGNIIIDKSILYVLLLLYYFLPFLSLSTRRIRDTGDSPFVCLLSFLGILHLFVIMVCLFKKKDINNKKYLKKANDKKLGFASRLILLLFLSPYLLIAGLLVLDLIFIGDGKITHLTTNINDYEEEVNNVKNAKDLLPSLDSLNDYEEIKFSSQEKLYSSFLGLYAYGISIFVSYDENFIEKKNEVLNEYDYLEEPIYQEMEMII